jgi:hypothetical protein
MAAVKKEAEEIGKMHTPVDREVWWDVSTPLFGFRVCRAASWRAFRSTR